MIPQDNGSRGHFDYVALERLRQAHAGWRLLRADHASMVVSFLHRTFVEANVRSLPQSELVSRLDDYLHALREVVGPDEFPRPPGEYLDEWANDKHAWLRKAYPADSEEPHFDITSAAHSAITWLSRLGQRQFVGTESRLLTVLQLLKQIVEGTETNRDLRLAELEKRRKELDEAISRIRSGGEIDLLDPTQVRDRFQQMADMANGILADFREVEANLRELDRWMRERIATWDGGKGALVEEIFGARDAIADSDTGRSFRAFWDFLMAPDRQDELTSLLERVFRLDAVQKLEPDRRLKRVHYAWLTEGEVTQRTVARLSEQLRRYLDDQTFLESRRIMELIRRVEQAALAIREVPPKDPIIELDEPAPEIHLPHDRPLFAPTVKPTVDSDLTEGSEDIDADALFEQVHVDKPALRAHIRQMLQLRTEVSLSELVEVRPLEHGLAELITYVSLATDDKKTAIDEATQVPFMWLDRLGRHRRARLPLIIFRR